MYGNYLDEEAKIVAENREKNIKCEPARLTAEQKDELLLNFHPDRIKEQFKEIKIGANKGQKAPIELTDMLEAKSRIDFDKINLSKADYETDVLIIGGGGAGCSAAIEASNRGSKVLLITKLRVGDANTMMAEGGIQAADKPNDSPAQHYLDAFGGGHFDGKPELVYTLVNNAPDAIKWLNELGVEFDKEKDGTMITTHGGGTSRKRMHACKDYSGAEIMRTLRDETFNRPDKINVVDFTAAIEIIKNEQGDAAGAVLMNIETGEIRIAKAKVVIIATGGAGRMHYQGFPTSNHYGATADGLVLAYRAGAKLMYQDSLQYHPTGAAYPSQILGKLVTEKVRSLGAKLVNAKGDVYIHPLETRDVNASGIIREVSEGRGIKNEVQDAVWLDTPMIEKIHGEGTIKKRIPAMYNMFIKYGIDITVDPILVYPTLHYQNGGIEIDKKCHSTVKNLLAAGEVTGGVHGTNRLMGNSLLDVVVFGRVAGIEAAELASKTELSDKLSLDFVKEFEKQRKEAGINTDEVSPKILPKYTHGNPVFEEVKGK
ncbi:MAG: FAD-dependent oxidoreductase [Treponema sp.]|uniref:FAD-dependent oxidoreductase n=1 Tax=Treponema sp. TaxID=166 RepID=UPI001B61ED87|nr:FAD-dependent oxidoreductase [Treponema sp.]MBP5588868.1 FAD-dependent oxidoreductase [Treponema sp.]MCR5387123.1 FAD-dependent oxidoreductase [Treponema sp.]